jgi:hypothetical protein
MNAGGFVPSAIFSSLLGYSRSQGAGYSTPLSPYYFLGFSEVVEPDGIEPTTSSMPLKRSPN